MYFKYNLPIRQTKGNSVQDIVDIRIRNGRQAIEQYGGITKLSRDMGYSNPSFLTQQFGPMAGTDNGTCVRWHHPRSSWQAGG